MSTLDPATLNFLTVWILATWSIAMLGFGLGILLFWWEFRKWVAAKVKESADASFRALREAEKAERLKAYDDARFKPKDVK